MGAAATRITANYEDSMDLPGFASVVARWAGPIDFEVVQICGYGPGSQNVRTTPAQPPHNPPRTDGYGRP